MSSTASRAILLQDGTRITGNMHTQIMRPADEATPDWQRIMELTARTLLVSIAASKGRVQIPSVEEYVSLLTGSWIILRINTRSRAAL